MKVLKNLSEVAKELKVEDWRVQKEFKEYFPRRCYMNIEGNTVIFEGNEEGLEYVLVDLDSDEDCREYMLKYEVGRFYCEVYTDDIVGFEECKIIDIKNIKWNITRATVITKTGTQLNRVVKDVIDKEDEDYKKDGCIYFFSKE